MWKILKSLIIVSTISLISFSLYDYYRADLHTRPEMPEGAFSISYKNGLRVIIVNVPNERDRRRYFGTPFKVPFYLENTWSFCEPPKLNEEMEANKILQERNWPGERLDAICKIEIENEIVLRGLITSVPNLDTSAAN